MTTRITAAGRVFDALSTAAVVRSGREESPRAGAGTLISASDGKAEYRPPERHDAGDVAGATSSARRSRSGIAAGVAVVPVAVLLAAASTGAARAQQPAAQCSLGASILQTTVPNVAELRVGHDTALADAAVRVRLDASATSYTYTLPHLPIDRAADGSSKADARFASAPTLIAIPSKVPIVDGVLSTIDDGTPASDTCDPTLIAFRHKDTKRSRIPAADAERAVAPTVGSLAPLTCADPFVEAKVDGSPVVANFPLIAQSLHQSGTATIEIIVGADGVARDATVYATSGYHELDVAGVVAALRTRYRSRVFRCAPVSTAVLFVSGFEPR